MDESYGGSADVIMVPAPSGGVRRGDLIVIGKLCGVAVTAAHEGEEVEILSQGCFDFPKDRSRLPLGAPAHWDAAAGKITAAAPDRPRIGVAVGDAPETAEIVRVRLDGFIL